MKNRCDIVYFVKESETNDELKYSLRTVEKNWPYRYVWFCGGCPKDLKPDKKFRFQQKGLNKWEKVRNSIRLACENEEISEDFWLFNDDFFILKPYDEDMKPQYNGQISSYIDSIVKKHNGSHSQYTLRLADAIRALAEAGLNTYNYEVHKPMLINRKKALEVLDKFPNVPGFRSIYGNYWKIGGTDRHDMKIKQWSYDSMDLVENEWDFLSTSDSSFASGEVGAFIKQNFKERSRFEL